MGSHMPFCRFLPDLSETFLLPAISCNSAILQSQFDGQKWFSNTMWRPIITTTEESLKIWCRPHISQQQLPPGQREFTKICVMACMRPQLPTLAHTAETKNPKTLTNFLFCHEDRKSALKMHGRSIMHLPFPRADLVIINILPLYNAIKRKILWSAKAVSPQGLVGCVEAKHHSLESTWEIRNCIVHDYCNLPQSLLLQPKHTSQNFIRLGKYNERARKTVTAPCGLRFVVMVFAECLLLFSPQKLNQINSKTNLLWKRTEKLKRKAWKDAQCNLLASETSIKLITSFSEKSCRLILPVKRFHLVVSFKFSIEDSFLSKLSSCKTQNELHKIFLQSKSHLRVSYFRGSISAAPARCRDGTQMNVLQDIPAKIFHLRDSTLSTDLSGALIQQYTVLYGNYLKFIGFNWEKNPFVSNHALGMLVNQHNLTSGVHLAKLLSTFGVLWRPEKVILKGF